MSDIVSNVNISYPAGSYVFPSSSTDGKGKLLTESNLRDITEKIQTRNFKELPIDFNLSISNGISMTSGTAIINGYKIYIPTAINLGDPVTSDWEVGEYDICIQIATQQSTDGLIADTYNSGNGVMYIVYSPKSDTARTINDLDVNSKYKVAVNRFNGVNVNNNTTTSYFSDNYEHNVLPDISDSSERFSTSAWVLDRHNGLYISNAQSISLKDIPFNALYTFGLGNSVIPTYRLAIGSLVVGLDGDNNPEIKSVSTYNCTQRIDVDDIYVGDMTFGEYIASVGTVLKTYGGNIITAIRENNSDSDFDDTYNIGTLTKVPYVSTLDMLYWSYTNEGSTKYSTDYLYVPYTYIGESYAEVSPLEYNSATTYNKNDKVVYEDIVYVCKQDSTSNKQPDTNPTYWDKSVSDTIDGDDVTTLQSVLECSFNSVPNTNNGDLDSTPYGSQILNVTSYNDCYTKYSYNILQQEYDSDDDEFNLKKCSLNAFKVGLYNPSNYLNTIIENDDYTETPPFGIYSENASALIKRLYDTTATTLIDTLELKTSTNGSIKLTANVTEINKSSLDEYDASESYDIGALVIYKNLIWRCNTDDTTGVWTPSKWDVAYISSGNIFETDSSGSRFNIYDESAIVNSVGFKNNGSNKAIIEFDNGTKQSNISIKDTNDTNNDPILEFSDNINVVGYVRANRVYNAVYNDYAEWYHSSNAQNIEEGDIIYYNPEKDEYNNHYESGHTVVGVCSEYYGFIVGGEDLDDMQENRKNYVPVSLCGRARVKLDKSTHFECGEFVYANGSNIGVKCGEGKVGKFLKYIGDEYGLIQVSLS